VCSAGTNAGDGLVGNLNLYLFKGNSVLSVGPSEQQSASGAYGTFGTYINTVPGGLSYLLSSNQLVDSTATSLSPYSRFMVMGSKITIRLCPDVDTAGSDVNRVLRVILVPIPYNPQLLAGAQYAPSSPNNLRELPYAKEVVISGGINVKPTTISHQMTTKKIFGLTREVATNDGFAYSGTYSGDPLQSWVWLMAIHQVNLINTATGYIIPFDANIEHDTCLWNLNNLRSTIPA
jgi:hypothetical protein